MWLYSSLWILKRCIFREKSILEVYGEPEEELGCGKPPRANSRGCSPSSARLRQTVAGSCQRDRRWLPPAVPQAWPPQGKHPAPPKPDSIRPYGVCHAGWHRAGKDDAAPGCEGNKVLAQRPKSQGWGRVWRHRECFLRCFLLPILNYLADESTQLYSTAVKRHLGLL